MKTWKRRIYGTFENIQLNVDYIFNQIVEWLNKIFQEFGKTERGVVKVQELPRQIQGKTQKNVAQKWHAIENEMLLAIEKNYFNHRILESVERI